MSEENIIAKSEEGNGLLPMKESEEKEKNKSEEKKNIETCNFIKNAFCIDGDVEMIVSDKGVSSKLFFKCNDSRRGKFWVAYGEVQNE